MANSFCTQCGAALLPKARFCTACGRKTTGGGAARPALSAPGLERLAPLLVVGVVVGLGGLAVGLGTLNAAPPNVPPPRGQAAAGGMPEGHPPLEVPEDVRKVIAKMADAAKAKPDDLETWRQLGFVQYRAGQVDPTYLDGAAASYTHVLDKAPDDLDALRALGNIAYDRNDPTRATEYYRRYLTKKPDDLGIQTDLATMQLAAKQYDAALAGYEAVLRADPKFFQAQFNLAIAYRAKGEDEQAMAALRRAREIATDDDTRKRVDALIAHVSGAAPPPGAQAADEGEPAGGGDLHGAVEAIFRSHPIVGSRIDRVEWAGDNSARVLLRGFPMASMPPMVREKFIDRIRGGVRQAKSDHQVTAVLTVELVDAESGTVMETVTE